MIVTDIVPIDKKRSKVYIDESYAFPLYVGELRKYNIKVDEEVTQATYDEIMTEVIQKRCKLRAMNILIKCDKTEKQIREKLEQGFYPKNVIEDTISYMKMYGYIDDGRYVSNYLIRNKSYKSTKQIMAKLSAIGITKENIRRVVDEMEYNEEEAINKIIQKKNFDINTATFDERRKMYQFLLRRGFEYADIDRVLNSNKNN